MASSEEEWNDPFAALNEPFAGLNKMDFELHGIYMDHEPENEFVSTLDKCKDNFLNVLLNDANLRNASMFDEMRARYRVHDPNIKWDKMEPKLGNIFESAEQHKFCVANYVVSHGYQIYFAKCDSVRTVAKCGKRNEENQCPFRLHVAWMYKERSLQIKTMTRIHKCSRSFTFGSIIANKPKLKLREIISDIKWTFRCDVSLANLIEGKLTEHYARIWDYSYELLRSNPGSTCKVSVINNPDGKSYFHIFYTRFKALTSGCRKVIGLDGCFLKGEVKGELLTTIEMDTNNHVTARIPSEETQ
uniref:Transposase MuDR plant domain-containing protein n=1 Tax=Lactuca sativa TaxID=4236 RepID=A0A9R1V0I7_LACSA|nr:hypothetical protein LSAT_V11C700366060 [Lactuca sativa]